VGSPSPALFGREGLPPGDGWLPPRLSCLLGVATMTDEPEDQGSSSEPEAKITGQEEQATATADKDEKKEAGKEGKKEEKLVQTVEMTAIGPCRKHIKVSVDRAAIDERFNEKYKELVGDAQIPGFRPGKAPRRIVVRHYEK